MIRVEIFPASHSLHFEDNSIIHSDNFYYILMNQYKEYSARFGSIVTR
jgi:hypothetical protein